MRLSIAPGPDPHTPTPPHQTQAIGKYKNTIDYFGGEASEATKRADTIYLDTQYTAFDVAFFNNIGSGASKVDKRKAAKQLFDNINAIGGDTDSMDPRIAKRVLQTVLM